MLHIICIFNIIVKHKFKIINNNMTDSANSKNKTSKLENKRPAKDVSKLSENLKNNILRRKSAKDKKESV